jgi:hypothetical protein
LKVGAGKVGGLILSSRFLLALEGDCHRAHEGEKVKTSKPLYGYKKMPPELKMKALGAFAMVGDSGFEPPTSGM